MKAIDFACRLLARLGEDDQPRATQQVLLALAAGLERSADIARLSGLTTGGCTGILRSLTGRKLVRRIGAESGVYLLTPQGKELVSRYFSFLPRNQA